ncbi:sensor histidine kinase [Rheinheimera sp. 1928-s]|uniref:sensor histidine kinase n=1 Tax=Rheinheimera sp. 1928-s TaxID=3033803 RepID=UPI002604FF73|nr:sensor histidine kinase [Rheinheimera sp. 1928-s]MDF3125528.1 two-component regulator propeller domain-containing protein [Rheinheimera sp. 1928-s]
MLSANANFTRISVDDGLPNASIYKILQDDDGYIWLGSTNTGLLRYNGYELEAFDVLPASVSENMLVPDIDALLIDQNDQLWVGSWGMGLSKVNIRTGEITHYSDHADSALPLASNYIQSLLMDQSGALWIGTNKGLQRLSSDGKLQTLGAEGSVQPLIHQRIWALEQSEDGRIWIATSNGLHQWTAEDGLSAAYQAFGPQNVNNEMRTLFAYGDKLWVGGRSALFQFDPASSEFHAVPFYADAVGPIINVLVSDQQGNMLVGTFDGVYKLSLASGRFEPFGDQPRLLPGINVRSLLVDRSGLLWVGSRERGLFYGRHQPSAFTDLTEWGEQAAALATEQFTAVKVEDDFLWLGTADQFHQLNRRTGAAVSFATSARVNAITRTSQGKLYLGLDNGLWQFDEKKQQLVQLDSGQRPNSTQWQNVRDLIGLPDGSVWLGLWQNGLMRWDPSGEHQHWLQDIAQQKVGDAVQVVQQIQGKIWLGTRYSGVFVLDPGTGQLQSLTQLFLADQAADIQCLAPGPENTVLICSRSGLLSLDLQNRIVSVLVEAVKLPSTELLGAYTDKQNNIWLFSAYGLTLKPYQQERLTTFTEQDGLNSKEMIFKAFSVSKRDNLYLGTAGGLAIVNAGRLWLNHHKANTRISAIWIDQKKLKPGIMQGPWSHIELKPGEGISLELASLDFHDPKRNQFIYQLEGVDNSWQHNTGYTKVNYSQLEPGTYQFKVLGSNQHGLFADKAQTLSIEVLPLWWQRGWVVTGIGLVLLLLLLGGHAYRLRHMRQINKLLQHSVQERANNQTVLETMVKERTKALQDSTATLSLRSRQLELSLSQLAENNKELKRLNNLKDEFISTVSHELRTPLTSIRGAVGLIASKAVDQNSEHYQQLLHTALGNSERLSQLINDLLDLQKFESGNFSLSFATFDMKQLVLQALDSIAPYAAKYQVSFQVKLEDCRLVADQTRLRQVVDNLLSNAIKFSSSGQTVMVQLNQNAGFIRFAVQDQGSGIPDNFRSRIFEKFSQADGSSSRKAEGTGLGLNICKTIIAAHHGTIGFDSEPGQGALFWFELPLTQEEQPEAV